LSSNGYNGEGLFRDEARAHGLLGKKVMQHVIWC